MAETLKPSMGKDRTNDLLIPAMLSIVKSDSGLALRINVPRKRGKVETVMVALNEKSPKDITDDTWYGFGFHGLAYNLELFPNEEVDGEIQANIYTTQMDGGELSTDTDNGECYDVSFALEIEDGLLNKLAKDGMVFTRNERTNTVEYSANYGHATGIVFLENRTFKIFYEGYSPVEVSAKEIRPGTDMEQLLRDIAEAAGNLDAAYEHMFEDLAKYDAP
jgi:hypothetical protein